MKKLLFLFVLLLITSLVLTSCAQQPTVEEPAEVDATDDPGDDSGDDSGDDVTTIEFWYVNFTNWDQAMEALITKFEADNPDIKVNPVAVSYDEFNERVAAMVPVGEGPDVVVPYHGWVPLYKKSGFLAPIPSSVVTTEELDETLVEAADVLKFDGEYYGVPYYIMNYGLFYNKDYFAEAGIESPPQTWEELRELAIQCTQRDDAGNIVVNGYYQHFSQQDHIIWKNFLIQSGQPLFSDDHHTVIWNTSETGYEAWEWFVGLTIEDEVSEPYFNESAYAAFYTGEACMILAGPQVIGQIRTQAPDLNYGTAPMVTGTAENEEDAKFNVAQYWNFSITSKASQDEDVYEASGKFLKFLTTEEAVKTYTEITGALPPLKSLMDDPAYTEDEYLSAFIATLPYSQALFWVDEKAERQISMDMADRVMLAGEDPREVLDWGALEQQKLLDEYFGN